MKNLFGLYFFSLFVALAVAEVIQLPVPMNTGESFSYVALDDSTPFTPASRSDGRIDYFVSVYPLNQNGDVIRYPAISDATKEVRVLAETVDAAKTLLFGSSNPTNWTDELIFNGASRKTLDVSLSQATMETLFDNLGIVNPTKTNWIYQIMTNRFPAP